MKPAAPGRTDRGMRWGWWLLGSLLAVPGLVPWFAALPGQGGSIGLGWTPMGFYYKVTTLLYYLEVILTGADLLHPFGVFRYEDFLNGPLVLGHRTHLHRVLHLILVGALLFGLARLAYDRLGRRIPPAWRDRLSAPARRRGLGDLYDRAATLIGPPRPGRIGSTWPGPCADVAAAVLGSSLLYILLARVMYLHYFAVDGPFLFVGLALLLLPRRRLLAACVACLALLSAGFLVDIHRSGGSPFEEYGTTYARQVAEGRAEGGADVATPQGPGAVAE